MTEYYDYWIKLPETPAFISNITLMFNKIVSDGGTYPEKVSVGTKPNAGDTLCHFRLPIRLDGTEILVYLYQDMIAPKPPITVMLIRSAIKAIGDPKGYEVISSSGKAQFLPFINNVTDNTDPENPVSRPVNINDDIFLSTYSETEPFKLPN